MTEFLPVTTFQFFFLNLFQSFVFWQKNITGQNVIPVKHTRSFSYAVRLLHHYCFGEGAILLLFNTQITLVQAWGV